MESVKSDQGTEQTEAQDPVTLSDQELALISGAGGGISGSGILGGGISGSG